MADTDPEPTPAATATTGVGGGPAKLAVYPAHPSVVAAAQTPQSITFLVVTSLSLFMTVGLISTVYLAAHRCDAALIAIVSGLTGTALGSVGSILNNTRSQTPTTPDASSTTQ